jgi:hypothetical protein
MSLVLDHINGVNDDDYTPSNLRLLCPNCNSQTPTFCGRNMKRRHREPATVTPRQVREPPPFYDTGTDRSIPRITAGTSSRMSSGSLLVGESDVDSCRSERALRDRSGCRDRVRRAG